MNLEKLIQLLHSNKVIKDNGCWELRLRTKDGYSQIVDGDKTHRANRLSAAHYLGLNYNDPLQLACHKNECNNRRCWNPDHLYVGTHSQNSVDALNLGRRRVSHNSSKTHCVRGHEYTPENTNNRMGHRRCKQCLKMHDDIRNAKTKLMRLKRRTSVER